MSNCKNEEGKFNLSISKTTGKCGIGEKVGEESKKNKLIPVLSCEGACIRGEIARLAANYVAKNDGFQRGCHGELFSVPDSSIANWILNSEKIVCIDGCFLKCHSRIIENMNCGSKLLVFDALLHYKKYNDIFDADDVPEDERKEVAGSVAKWVFDCVKNNIIPEINNTCCDKE